ncbi:MAG: hypothetical protein D6701_05460, partial [Gemmatimonadetes bacterium]
AAEGGVGAPGAAEAALHARELQQAAAESGPAGRVHVRLDDVDGMGTRLDMTLRGRALDTSITLDDPAAARRMRERVAELHRALERRGFEAEALRFDARRGVEVAAERQGPRGDAARAGARLEDQSGRSASEHRSTSRDPRDGHDDPARRRSRDPHREDPR